MGYSYAFFFIFGWICLHHQFFVSFLHHQFMLMQHWGFRVQAQWLQVHCRHGGPNKSGAARWRWWQRSGCEIASDGSSRVFSSIFLIFNDYYVLVISRTQAIRLNFMPRFITEVERSPLFISTGYALVLKLKRNDQNKCGQNPFYALVAEVKSRRVVICNNCYKTWNQ